MPFFKKKNFDILRVLEKLYRVESGKGAKPFRPDLTLESVGERQMEVS